MKENTLIFKELEALIRGQKETSATEQGTRPAQNNKAEDYPDERAAATFTNLISEFDLILACYQEAASEFITQVKKVQGKEGHTPASGLGPLSEGFKRVITLMTEHNERMKQSGLTTPVHPNPIKA